MVNINSLPSKLKLDLRHLIVSKYEIVRETRTVRKEFILIRKKAYASSKIYSLETKVTKKMKKWKRNKRVRELVYKKIGKI